MTGFHQRQDFSTLTAPGARGFSPHCLVQPNRQHTHSPATETKIQFITKGSEPNYRPSEIRIILIPQNVNHKIRHFSNCQEATRVI